MKKIIFILLIFIFSTPAFSVPARLGGFSYNRDKSGRIKLSKKTQEFNEGPLALKEEVPTRFYLNEDGSDARTGLTPQEDKYKLVPIYKEREAHERRNSNTKEGTIEEEEENDDEEEEED